MAVVNKVYSEISIHTKYKHDKRELRPTHRQQHETSLWFSRAPWTKLLCAAFVVVHLLLAEKSLVTRGKITRVE